MAQDTQNNWEPNRYKVVCGEDNSGCSRSVLWRAVEQAAPKALSGLRELKFRPPNQLGPVIDDHVQVSATRETKLAWTQNHCDPLYSTINLGTQMAKFQGRESHMVFLLAHEMMHAIHRQYPAYRPACGAPGWVNEGTADAVGEWVARKTFPSQFPGHFTERDAEKFSGLRRYDVPLNTQIGSTNTRIRIYYQTSSFWRHLGEAYHDGGPGYLDRYFSVSPDGGDWLGWLSRRLVVDPKVKAELGHVFAGFLADYANWGKSGLPGQYFGNDKWLNKSFGGCRSITLRPRDGAEVVDFELRASAGKCLRVKVAGVQPGQLSSIKVAALARGGGLEHMDQIHLSLANSTDASKFSCARETRKAPKRVLKKCVFIPDTGTAEVYGNTVAARVWQVRGQEIQRGGGFENLYIVSRTAVRPTDSAPSNRGGEVLGVDMVFSLETTQLTISGTAPAVTGQQRSVSQYNLHAMGNAHSSVPLRGPGGGQVRSFSNPNGAAVPGMQILPPVFPISGKPGGLFMMRWANVGISNSSSSNPDIDEREMFSTIPFGEDEEPAPLQTGETGEYDVGITGGFGMDQYLSGSKGRFSVASHTPWTMDVRLSGIICRTPAKPNTCPGKRTIEGQATKALPVFYQPLGGLVVEDTPGTRQYREMLQHLHSTPVAAPSTPSAPANDAPAAPPNPFGNMGQGDCDCSCETFAKLRKMTSSSDDLSADELAQVMRLAMCSMQCQLQFSQCK